MIRNLVLSGALLCAFLTPAAQAADGGPPSPGYTLTSSAGSFFAGGSLVTGTDTNDALATVDLPFDFPFYGRTYNSATISTNGNIRFGDGPTAASLNDRLTECPGLPSFGPTIFAFWVDLDLSSGGVYTSGNTQQFTVQWRGETVSGGQPVGVQAMLEPDGDIIIDVGTNNGLGGSQEIVAIQGHKDGPFTNSNCNQAGSLPDNTRKTFSMNRPTLSGTTKVGDTITSDPGTWVGLGPIDLTTRWRACAQSGESCNVVPGTGASYVVRPDDAGGAIRSQVVGIGPEDSFTRRSLESAVVTGDRTHLMTSITGSLNVGDVVQAGRIERNGVRNSCSSPKAPSALDNNTARRRDTYSVVNTTGQDICAQVIFDFSGCGGNQTMVAAYRGTFNPSDPSAGNPADWGFSTIVEGAFSISMAAGETIQLVVHETDPNTGCPLYRLFVAADRPVRSTAPAISGTTTAGQTLTTTDGGWTGSPTFSREWLRCGADGANCSAIAGATNATYTPTGDDVGKTLRTRITASDTFGSANNTSDKTAVIAAAPAAETPPATTPPATTPPAVTPLAKLKLGKVRFTKKGVAVVPVTVAAAGKVAGTLRKGKVTIARGTRTAKAAGTVRLRMRLTKAGRRLVRQAKQRTRLRVTFTPTAGDVQRSGRKRVTFPRRP